MTRSPSIYREGLALALLLSGCGGGAPPVETRAPRASEPAVPTPTCRFEGSWNTGTVRAARGGFELALVSGGDVRADLVSPDRVVLTVTRGGWSLRGAADPGRDRTLRVQAARPLGAGVALAAGRAVRVFAIEADGRLRVGLSDNGPGISDGVRWVVQPRAVVACDALGLRSPHRGSAWAELGLDPASIERSSLAPSTEIPLREAPGGRTLALLDGPRRVGVVERRAGSTRVAFEVRGHLIAGWVDEGALQETSGRGGFGGLGQRGAEPSQTVCRSREPLAVHARTETSAPEPVGGLAPGTRFVRLGELEDGGLQIAPHPEDHVSLARGVVLSVTPTGPVTCAIDAPMDGGEGVTSAP